MITTAGIPQSPTTKILDVTNGQICSNLPDFPAGKSNLSKGIDNKGLFIFKVTKTWCPRESV